MCGVLPPRPLYAFRVLWLRTGGTFSFTVFSWIVVHHVQLKHTVLAMFQQLHWTEKRRQEIARLFRSARFINVTTKDRHWTLSSKNYTVHPFACHIIKSHFNISLKSSSCLISSLCYVILN
jgi:hypothetical protein